MDIVFPVWLVSTCKNQWTPSPRVRITSSVISRICFMVLIVVVVSLASCIIFVRIIIIITIHPCNFGRDTLRAGCVSNVSLVACNSNRTYHVIEFILSDRSSPNMLNSLCRCMLCVCVCLNYFLDSITYELSVALCVYMSVVAPCTW